MIQKLFFFTTSIATLLSLTPFAASHRQNAGVDGFRGLHPYLFKSASQKSLVETARDHQWSIQFHKSHPDTINIVAFRIEFVKDTSVQTTGNGLFGIRLGGDKDEINLYDSDTAYIYDDLPHDSLYFAHQLTAVRNYFTKVSRGNLYIDFSIYPKGEGETGYAVEHTMPYYSPGGKKKKESYDHYYERKMFGLISFIRDAVKSADNDSKNSPFASLYVNSSDGTIRNENGHKTVFLIFHAGASYLTDGGQEGVYGEDTPSDMIDAFITPDVFKYYRDTLELSDDGIIVNGKDDDFLIDEIMMCSETSNQDGLNWGIQGILVNQIARQLGIPDLFSTYSGTSGIGAFCIMDFAGYSAAKGFIPSYPSAWVRAFMGWDNVFVTPVGKKETYHVKALTSVLDRDTLPVPLSESDTTILLIPINDHEYYLIENRQRNLSGDRALFQYDTTTESDYDLISNYPYIADIDNNVLSSTGKNKSNVIQRALNNDIGIPASGVLVWHVDENIIRKRMSVNAVNVDSSYRGVSLVEADGITDLGITFQDVFYQAAFDYGGSEDVFPHTTVIEDIDGEKVDTTIEVFGFGPSTFPSTRANDGGHTWLDLSINPTSDNPGTEISALGKNDGTHYITNFSDSVFTISVDWNYLSPTWPRLAVPESFYDPLLVDIDNSTEDKELFLVGKSGRSYLWPSDDDDPGKYNTQSTTFNRVDLHNDTLTDVDTVHYFDSIPHACAMPTALVNCIAVPSGEKAVYFYRHVTDSASTARTILELSHAPSTYLCNYHDSSWALGCENGRIIFGKMMDTIRSISLKTDKPVSALAARIESPSSIIAIQHNGIISLVENSGDVTILDTLTEKAIPPFTLTTADLDGDSDSSSEIIVSDSRQGLWVFKSNGSIAPGWDEEPIDWPAYYSPDTSTDRRTLPLNASPPALADIDRNGFLDIVIGGTNGLYALNYKGALKSGWPAYLDKKYWFQRGSITSAPVVVTGDNRQPLVLFSSLTGENVTFNPVKISKADRKKGIVWYNNDNGTLDSLWDLTPKEVDTIVTLSDSLIWPYVIPGGIIDAVNAKAKRPRPSATAYNRSNWPLSTGASLNVSPLIGFMDSDKTPDLFAVSSQGWVYRWELGSRILPDTLFWPQTGYCSGRSFAYGGKQPPKITKDSEPVTFFSFPNPTRGVKQVTFKYKFNAPATKVKLSIYSYTGFKVYSTATMGAPPRNLTGSFPDWNVHHVRITNLGPGIYRCRLEATINGKKHHRYWKMAVIK